MVLILGIAGELLGAVRTSQLSGQIIANIEERASEADRQAGIANEKAAAAQERAGKLEKEAEDERSARVKIEARVAWRHLTDEQKTEIGTKLGDFSNQEGASLWYLTGDTEAVMFAIDIAEALKKAHIAVQPPADMMEMHESGRFGDPVKHVDTGVIVQAAKDERSRSLAGAVVSELTSRGFDARRGEDNPPKGELRPIIWVFVRPRPEGPQGELKLQAEADKKQKAKITHNPKP